MSEQMTDFITTAVIVLIAAAVIIYLIVGMDSGSDSQIASFVNLFS